MLNDLTTMLEQNLAQKIDKTRLKATYSNLY